MRDTLGLKTAWGGPARKHTLGKTRGPSCAQTAGGEDELWQGRLAFLQTTHVWAPPPPDTCASLVSSPSRGALTF